MKKYAKTYTNSKQFDNRVYIGNIWSHIDRDEDAETIKSLNNRLAAAGLDKYVTAWDWFPVKMEGYVSIRVPYTTTVINAYFTSDGKFTDSIYIRSSNDSSIYLTQELVDIGQKLLSI